jgi:hypothetical protein
VFVAGAGAAPGSHPAAGNEYRAELAQAKRREAEASTRVAALEAKLKSSSSGFGEMQATIQELTHRVQVCCNFPSLASELFTCECVVVLSVCSPNGTGQLSKLEKLAKGVIAMSFVLDHPIGMMALEQSCWLSLHQLIYCIIVCQSKLMSQGSKTQVLTSDVDCSGLC